MRDSGLTVRFELLGRDETRIESWSLDSSYLTSADGFDFVHYSTDRDDLFSLELEPVELLVGGASQALGRIDQTEIGGNGRAVTCRGRDYIADIVECNVDPSLVIQEGMTVGAAIALTCGPCGISTVTGDEGMAEIRTGQGAARRRRGTGGGRRVAKIFHELKAPDLKPKGGEGQYEFCNRLAARYGATIQPARSRDTLALSAPDYKSGPLYEIKRTDDQRASGTNNVISATATRDYSRFPTTTLCYGKFGRAGEKQSSGQRTFDMAVMAEAFGGELGERLNSALIATGRVKPRGSTILPPILYRLLHIQDDDARTDEQLDDAARRAIAERLKDTLEYKVTVKGHTDRDSGAVWSVNTMVHVTDAICGLEEDLWIAGRTLRFSQDSGATTELTCWRPESFQIGDV